MATSVGGIVFHSVISALAFSGGSWLFSKLDHKGYLEESERHNKALEELTAARNTFYEEEVKRKDRIVS